MLDCVRGRCTFEAAANSKEAFFIDEWVQLVKVAVELDNAFSFPRTSAILELVVVTFKRTKDLDLLFEVVVLN